MAKLITINELVTKIYTIQPGDFAEYGRITIRRETGNRWTLNFPGMRNTVMGTVNEWEGRPDGEVYVFEAYKPCAEDRIRGEVGNPQVAWKTVIKYMRELHNQH